VALVVNDAAIRSLLFVPGNKQPLIGKALASAADAVILDLEDAVADQDKLAARAVCAGALRDSDRRGKAVFVRVNAFDTGLTAGDLAAVVAARPWGIVLPKCLDTSSVAQLGYYLDALEAREGIEPGSTRILTIATETAEATLRLGQVARPAPARLWGAMWGDEDLSCSLGASASRDEQGNLAFPYQWARAQCLYACSVLGVRAIDSVHVDFRDLEGLERETARGQRDGFTAKAAIHPAQAEVINRVLTPDKAQVAWAHQVLDLLGGKGVAQLDGKMLNLVHRRMAALILQRAALFGDTPA
jgi:citrate lyase subunit beta / citryl-CoA lyase